MIKIFSIMMLLSIFFLIIILLIKEAKSKLYLTDNIIFNIIDFLFEEDIVIGILLGIIILIIIIIGKTGNGSVS